MAKAPTGTPKHQVIADELTKQFGVSGSDAILVADAIIIELNKYGYRIIRRGSVRDDNPTTHVPEQ